MQTTLNLLNDESIIKAEEGFNEEIDLDLLGYEDDEEINIGDVVTVNDGLILSLRNMGKVDVKYIAEVSGVTPYEVVNELKGVIYQNPVKCNNNPFDGFEESSEYLSGNLYKKLLEAKDAQKTSKLDFSENIKSIESLLTLSKANLKDDEIYITLGTSWIPPKYIREFMLELLENSQYTKGFSVKRDDYTGVWTFTNGYLFKYSFNNSPKKYGTPDMDAVEIIKKTLNNQDIAVFDENTAYDGRKTRILNKEATLLAIQKQKQIIEIFQEWIWKDEKRKEKLKEIFVNKYACIRKRVYNGSFLELKGSNKDITLMEHQKNAVARIVFTKNCLLSNAVGSGKTFIMAASAMELKRLGMSKKNMFCVPNNIVREFAKEFTKLYPEANLLVIDPDTFKKNKRFEVLSKIKQNDYDGIVIAYSCFEGIKMSKLSAIKDLKEEIDKISKSLANQNNGPLEKERNRLLHKLDKLKADYEEEKELANQNIVKDIYFDELGITRLYVDECHNWKNLPINTSMHYILGLSCKGSKKNQDMYDKVKYVQNVNNGGVIMATGTPITNSICDIYVFQKYLEEAELKMLDINNFDDWLKMFAEETTEMEVDVDTNSFRLATRFSKFHNIPELTSLLSIVSDFYNGDKFGLPKFSGYTDIVLKKNKHFVKFLGEISERADAVRNRKVKRTEDNLLKITVDSRQAALDLRLLSDKYHYDPDCKAQRCADEASKLYFETMDNKSTQLIFCDSSTPKDGFNMYSEVKRLLIDKGVNEEEIAFIHDATTEAKKTKMFEKVRNGEIRILMGSTSKLGTGVNVQNKLIAIHHLDIPWSPNLVEQRNGRIIRQGNENEEVKIFRYCLESSFDAYSWQLLQYKQKMIDELLSGTMYDSSISDVSDTVLTYAEIKALAIGNPLLKKRFEIANEISRLVLLHKKELDKECNLKREENFDKDTIKRVKVEISNLEKDYQTYLDNKVDFSIKANQERRIDIRDRIIERYREYQNDNTVKYERDVRVFKYQGLIIAFPGKVNSEYEKYALKDENEYHSIIRREDVNRKQQEKTAKAKDYIYLINNGIYKVELGTSEIGYLIRIDNALESLGKKLEEKKVELKKVNRRFKELKGEYENIVDYSTEIDELKSELAKLDIKLGVNK